MEKLENLLDTFDDLATLLYDARLEPDPQRTDWAQQRGGVDELAERYEKDLIPQIDDIAEELDERITAALKTRAGYIGLGVFAALHASGQAGRALPLVATVADYTRGGSDADFFAAASRDPDSARELALLRHRLANDIVQRVLASRSSQSRREKKRLPPKPLRRFTRLSP